MASVYHDSVAPAGSLPASGLSSWISRRVEAWKQYRHRSREVHDLSMFSDRELWDVGLSRSDLMALEKGVYRRD